MTHDEINHAIEILNALKDGKTVCDKTGRSISPERVDVVYDMNTIALSQPMDGLRASKTTKVVPWTADDHEDFKARKFILDGYPEEEIFHASLWNNNGVQCYPDDLDYVESTDYSGTFITYADLAQRKDCDGNPCGKVVEEQKYRGNKQV